MKQHTWLKRMRKWNAKVMKRICSGKKTPGNILCQGESQ